MKTENKPLEARAPISISNLMANIVSIIHLLLILFVLFAPLSSDREILTLHVKIAVSLILKWLLNFKCAFTELEYLLRGIKKEEGFIYSILQPIVSINEYKFNYLIYSITLLLGYYSYTKLYP